ncbi:MAG TPA: response regulator [Kofleriaceae bacterium]|nr:response regulator [Kofleriaceae bacterium]
MPGSILIVEDDADTAVLLREVLRKRGYEVSSVDSARGCLEWLETHRVDLVISDVHMVGMDGIQLCERLRDRRDLIVIVMTAAVTVDTAAAACKAGAFDFVAKPVRMAALCGAVERAFHHLGARRAQSQAAV